MTRGFPTVEEVVAIHADQIAQFGGAVGLRDMGALESALLRPQMGYYDGPIEEAAALIESLAMNYPFVDGNKRVAFFTTDAFLRMNGTFIDCDSQDRPTIPLHAALPDQLIPLRRAPLVARRTRQANVVAARSHDRHRPRLAGCRLGEASPQVCDRTPHNVAIGRTITFQLDAP